MRIKADELTEENVKQIALLEADIFSDPWSEKSVTETIRQPHARVSAAWKGDELAGYIILYYVMDECEIARIAVKENFRRKGVAGRLLDETELFCRENGIQKIMLDVRESNVPAITFYKKNKFIQDGIRKRFYTNPAEDAILMSRRIVK